MHRGHTAKGQRTRRRIVTAVAELARDQGITQITLNRISRVTGLTKSALFRYFKNREAMLCGGVELWAQSFKDEVLQPTLEVAGLARVWMLCERWLGAFDRLMPPTDVFRGSNLNMDSEGDVRVLLANELRIVFDYLVEALERARERSELLPEIAPADLGMDLFGILLAVPATTRMFGVRSAIERAARSAQALLERSAVRPAPIPGPHAAAAKTLHRISVALGGIYAEPRMGYPSQPPVQLRTRAGTGRLHIDERWDPQLFDHERKGPAPEFCPVCFLSGDHDSICPRRVLGAGGDPEFWRHEWRCPLCFAIGGHSPTCVDSKLAIIGPQGAPPRLSADGMTLLDKKFTSASEVHGGGDPDPDPDPHPH